MQYLKIEPQERLMTTIQTITTGDNNNVNNNIDSTTNPIAFKLLFALIIVLLVYTLTIVIICYTQQRYKKRLYKNYPNLSYDQQYNQSSCC